MPDEITPAAPEPGPDRPPKEIKWPPKWRRFLKELSKCGNVRAACRASNVSRSWAKEKRAKDPDFAAAWEDALEEGADRLEQSAHVQALRGLPELLLYKGQPVQISKEEGGHLPGFVEILDKSGQPTGQGYLVQRRRSVTLTIFLLKGARPEKYADRHKVDAQVNGELGLNVTRDLAAAISAARANRLGTPAAAEIPPDVREALSEAETAWQPPEQQAAEDVAEEGEHEE